MSSRNSILVQADAASAWALIRQFHNLDWAQPVIEQCDIVGAARPQEIGATRRLNGGIVEHLVALDDLDRKLRYRIADESALPNGISLTGCVSEVEVIPVTADAHCLVQWKSNWESAEGNAGELLDTIYQALLGALKAHLEG
ncbi:MAG: SRPBCC family protein [Wenzhouxiangellaceae bacterium]